MRVKHENQITFILNIMSPAKIQNKDNRISSVVPNLLRKIEAVCPHYVVCPTKLFSIRVIPKTVQNKRKMNFMSLADRILMLRNVQIGNNAIILPI